MIDKALITKERKTELEKELKNLESVKRREIIEALEFAKSLGDLSENAEYHEARENQAKLESRVEEIKRIIKEAKVVPSRHKGGIISIGSKVTVQKKNSKEKKNYTVVGEGEADMSAGKISYQSPLGGAIFEKKKGDKIVFNGPAGKIEMLIVNVE